MNHSEYATVYSESAKRRAVQRVLIRSLYNDESELIFVAILLYQGVDGTVLQKGYLMSVAEDPKTSQDPERRELRRLEDRVLRSLDIAN